MKLDTTEQTTLQEFRQTYEEILLNVGSIEIQIQKLEDQKEFWLDKFSITETKEQTLLREIQEKYGDCEIDFETGEIKKISTTTTA